MVGWISFLCIHRRARMVDAASPYATLRIWSVPIHSNNTDFAKIKRPIALAGSLLLIADWCYDAGVIHCCAIVDRR